MEKIKKTKRNKKMAIERLRGRPYSLFPQQRKNGIVWYAQFRLPDGSFSSAKSTKQSTKSAAATWADEYLRKGQVVTKANMLFSDYAKDFFAPDSDYGTYDKLHSKRFSENRLKAKADKLRVHLMPYFANYKLSAITSAEINKLQAEMAARGRSSFTINDTVNVLLIILKAAYNKKYIQSIPGIEKVVIDGEERGCLSTDEVKKLFSLKWDNQVAFVGNLIAASTGLRQGEIVALQYQSVFSNYILVTQSWDLRNHKLKSTKNRKGRVVPLASKVYKAIMQLQTSALWKGEDAFIFQSEQPNKPMNPDILRDELYSMLERLGIDEKKRNERQICFHSWRHFFNSLLVNANISKFKIQSLIGHQSDDMTLNYYHPDEYKDVLKLQGTIFNK